MDAHARGIRVRVITDSGQSAFQHSEVGRLRAAGVPVVENGGGLRGPSGPSGLAAVGEDSGKTDGLMHHKVRGAAGFAVRLLPPS